MHVNRMGITFIGPSSDIMRAMGDKISSKQIAIAADVPIIPGVDHAMKSYEEAAKIADMVDIRLCWKGFQRWWRTRYAYCQ